MEYTFTFDNRSSQVVLGREMPSIETILRDAGAKTGRPFLVCDAHTEPLTAKMAGSREVPRCVLPPGEHNKGWASVETILRQAREAGLARDGLFIALGGGVVSDMAAFAASVYMRGARLALVSTTLLGMVDAALGGKTGFDLFDIKNLVGTFFPASLVYMPLESLETLPKREWKSGLAELIKTAVLDKNDRKGEFLSLLSSLREGFAACENPGDFLAGYNDTILECISRSVLIKGRIVEADPRETGTERALLNLGHTFAHALESAAGLGRLSHGEAVAWGMIRAGELGLALGITPREREKTIRTLLGSYGYEITAPHPLIRDRALFLRALEGDKKKRGGKLSFIVPAREGAEIVYMDTGAGEKPRGTGFDRLLLEHIIDGE
ncbi:MAG: 3-dehydroquinate synthase, partial [Treponema sp.]|nr:3-dehydroquinate synthase [Treponema sp.]